MSQQLTARSVEHVVLDRGDVADSWHTKRWPGLRLLTPNWMLRLPGYPANHPDPDGFLAAPEVANLVVDYARHIDAPVRTHTTVRSVRRGHHGYEVCTDDAAWQANSVVLAAGGNTMPVVPAYAAALPASISQLTAFTYRGPDSLPDGGVLVVGASATGVQLATELRQAGRPVTLAVGEHVQLPRTYRGHDIFWWLHSTGVLAERHDEIDDLTRARRLPSPQLVGSAVPVDLAALAEKRVKIVGRLTSVDRGITRFSGSLRNVCALADLKQSRFLARADQWATATGLDDDLPPPWRPERTPVPDRLCLSIDLATADISTLIWATGFRPDYSWLDLPILDRTGHLRHQGGVVTDAPGIYALGLPMLRTRASTYIHGATADTKALADRLVTHLTGRQHTDIYAQPFLPPSEPACNAGRTVDDDAVTHLSPGQSDHVNPYGNYTFDIERGLSRTRRRPLAQPKAASGLTTNFLRRCYGNPYWVRAALDGVLS
jgi:putative flavoprotein involved in K+ transport